MSGPTPFPPYPQSCGTGECWGMDVGGVKVEDRSPEAQVKDTEDLGPLISSPGQSRVPRCVVLSVSEEARPPEGDRLAAPGALTAPRPTW